MAASWPRPIEIFEHYLRYREALSSQRAMLLDRPETVGRESRFSNMAPDEIDSALRSMASELDIQINLLLIASGEANLRIDFRDRVERRRKDPVARRFRDLERQRKARGRKGVRLEDILKVWAEESSGSVRTHVGSMGKLLLYRHWIAHGRYWVNRRSGLNDPDPFEVWNILRGLFNNLHGFDPLPAQ